MLNHLTFLLIKPSALKKEADIIEYLLQNELTVLKKITVVLNKLQLLELYKEEIDKMIERNKEIAEAMIKAYCDTMEGKEMTLLLLESSKDAIEICSSLKGESYFPNKCSPQSLRYLFRDSAWDTVEAKPGEIIQPPTDNVVHCPRTYSEFKEVVDCFFTK